MSYLVLARKYRPMFFEDVVGQQHVCVTLQNAIEKKRIANAYIFSGPRGVGKTTVARLLSKALNCEHGPTTKPCNKCSSCLEINESRSLDVFEIDGASNRGIDEVRNLRDGLKYSSTPGKYRIYIIDEVHMLTNEAFNALLKTLEEPPANVLFVFATTESHKIPATILSRCQRFEFKRMSTQNIIKQLQELCVKEEIEIDNESLRLVASKADGSMRDSESILDQVIAFCGKTIQAKDVSNLLGIIDTNLFFQVTDFIKEGNVEGGIELSSKIFVEGYEFNEFLAGLAEHLRNFLIVCTTGKTEELNVSEEHAQRYLSEKEHFQVEDLLRLLQVATDAMTIIRKSTNARLHLEISLVKMIKMSKSLQLSQILTSIEELKKKPLPTVASPSHGDKPVQKSVTIPKVKSSGVLSFMPDKSTVTQGPDIPPEENGSSEQLSADISLADLEKKWDSIVDFVKKSKIALGTFLGEGWPVSLTDNKLIIALDENNGFHISTLKKNNAAVEELLKEYLGVQLSIEYIKDSQGMLESVNRKPQQVDKASEFDKLKEENPLVQKIVDTFDAKFVK